MAGTAVRGRLTWQTATVGRVTRETASAVTLRLEVPDWPGHRAGQHVDIRLTADDGYQAERAYSIASAPGEPLTITVERLDDGEVSPYLTEDARPGDQFEVRGPIGGYFVWEAGNRRAVAAGGRRFGRRAAAGHPAAPVPGREFGAGPAAVLLAQLGRRDLLQRARLPARTASR